jgi:hypothetical protein
LLLSFGQKKIGITLTSKSKDQLPQWIAGLLLHADNDYFLFLKHHFAYFLKRQWQKQRAYRPPSSWS